MKQFIQWTSFYAVLAAGVLGNVACRVPRSRQLVSWLHCWALPLVLAGTLSACRVDQNQRIGGEARATIVVSYPAAEACFDDQRLGTTEQLLRCLELTTGQRYIIDATGSVVEAIVEGMGGGAVDEPSNITATP